MFVLVKFWMSLKMGHVSSKTRSLGQMLEKPCACSRGHIFSLMILTRDQHVCLDEILHKFGYGHVGSKTRSPGQILEKPCEHSTGHIFSQVIINLVRMISLVKSGTNLKIGYVYPLEATFSVR